MKEVLEMKGLYTCSAIAGLTANATGQGYELVQFRPESLGYGGFVLMAPRPDWQNVVVEEVYLNEWSSAHKVRRCRKISKKLQKMIEEYENEQL